MKTDNKRNRILEVCCADLQSVRAAVEGGAQRIELCQALELDGVTPSAGMIEWAVECAYTCSYVRAEEISYIRPMRCAA